jgi:hypothetical protein
MMVLQVIGQAKAEMPGDLPVRLLARITQRNVVRPAWQSPVQLSNQPRYRRATLTAIRQFIDPVPLRLQTFFDAPP